jgi:hypothetical protein
MEPWAVELNPSARIRVVKLADSNRQPLGCVNAAY